MLGKAIDVTSICFDTLLYHNTIIIPYGDEIQSDVLLDGYKWVNIISFDHLKSTYNIEFDTLVMDYEGAFYYILQDFLEILTHIKTVIMENDYKIIDHKLYVANVLKQNNFKRCYVKCGGWEPCETYFFEVCKKNRIYYLRFLLN